jgi:hypothetical protein
VWNYDSRRFLLGYISVDCHERGDDNRPIDRTTDDVAVMDFQRCAMDLISHVAVRCVKGIWFKNVLNSR